MHSLGWIFFSSVLLIGFSRVIPWMNSLMLILGIFLPAIPAVYLHFYIAKKFFRRRMYVIYFLCLAAIVFGFGWIIEYILGTKVFPEDDNLQIASELMLGIMIIVATSLRYFFVGIEAENRMIETEARQNKAELDSLRMQVNPHFLFNSLNNIYGLLNDDVQRAGDSILTLSSLLRYMIYASSKTKISLEEEVQFLEDYMAMERLRLGEKCKLSFNKQGDYANKEISPFLFIPFVENAFKHGSFATIDESLISVDISIDDDLLSFSVANGTKPNAPSKTGGFGIANVKRRLELLLPERYQLDVTHVDNLFRVELQLKLNQ